MYALKPIYIPVFNSLKIKLLVLTGTLIVKLVGS